jgi:CheY-like chemotaxis protein
VHAPPQSTIRNATCAVASAIAAEVEQVHALIQGEFTELLGISSEADWPAFASRSDISVLVLAFAELDMARAFHHRYLEHCKSVGREPTQVVLLCAGRDVTAAYELCRAHEIFDYVLYWPMTQDPMRLPLVMHRACDIHERLIASIPPALDEPEPPPPVTTHSERSALHRKMVLVVDDDPHQCDLVKSVLEAGGVSTVTADNGIAALAMLEHGVPGLILLDVVMPDLDGFAVLRRLRAIRMHTTTPVIMLTAMRDRELVLATMRAGAVDFILKPFDHYTLLQKVRRVLSVRTPVRPSLVPLSAPKSENEQPDQRTVESRAQD